MFSSKQTNKRIDDIGKQLFSAAAMSEQEIETIASDPKGFDRVLAEVKRQEAMPLDRAGAARIWTRRIIPAAAGAVAVLVVFALLILKQNPAELVLPQDQVPSISSESARLEFTPQVTEKGFSAGRAIDTPLHKPAATQKATYVQRSTKSPVTKKTSVRKPIREPKFYPVTFSGDAREMVKGGRVIRVDVSRATLFAMGVDLPLENETASVKADLVVGPDGVARAFRLVE